MTCWHRSWRSRIDRDCIWSTGVPAAHSSLVWVRIDAALAALDHHCLLWANMQLFNVAAFACSTPLLQLRLPDLGRASNAHRIDLVAHVEAGWLQSHADLEEFGATTPTPYFTILLHV
jgi:hypothetical protein